jgi:hypothetical protein
MPVSVSVPVSVRGTAAIENVDMNIFQVTQLPKQQLFIGVVYALIAGSCFGVQFVPTLYTSSDASSMKFLLSAAVAQLILLPASVVMACCKWPFDNHNNHNEQNQESQSLSSSSSVRLFALQFEFRDTFGLSLMSGVLSGLGNVCGVIAFDILSYTLATTMINFTTVVSILCGILIWKEMNTLPEIALFSLFTLFVIGASIMVIYGA